ncbi:hypothetical protein EMGBS15_16750 [Filimonas sp.]|nr:hypothetical protein EMGBS15_16750 [Filimonas sp.]
MRQFLLPLQRKTIKMISIFMLLSQVFTFSTAEAQNWSSFPNGGANDWVYSSCIYNGDLIVGGKFTAIGGVNLNHIADGMAATGNH